ncbi:MAG: cobalamin biosynthesis protein, partial [Bacteroides sp.]|nr:cobalamin biosynthesis protein [Bacteroides sp.]
MVGWIDVLPLLLAWILDICIGDPMWIPHPVVGFGKLISKGEQTLNKGMHRMLKGTLLALLLVIGTFVVTAFVLGCLPGFFRWMVSVFLIFSCLAGTTLIREV